jgi:predicted ABC-type exoprotein transport system permease subunit
MEYKIFKFIRYNTRIPFFIRLFFWVILILISIIPIILPIFPGSFFLWIFIFLVWFLLIVPWHKIRYVIKIRKWIMYLAQNFHRKIIIEHKIRDIRNHVRDILKTKKN